MLFLCYIVKIYYYQSLVVRCEKTSFYLDTV